MHPDPAIAIKSACRGVRQGLQQWNAADLTKIGASRKLLEYSVRELNMAIDLLRKGDPAMSRGLQPAIANLRRDISTMIRLVNASAAFRRGLALRHGAALSAYDASGQVVGDPDALTPQGVLG